jgi:cytoskeletal protein CcmA (bactofilin family)
MWKKEDSKPQGVPENAGTPVSAAPTATPTISPADPVSVPVSSRAAACISQGIRIKGEVTGSEDLFVDGVVEGKLSLTTNSCLTVGPNGIVKADLNAREIIVRGKVEGKITARDKVELWSTGQVTGEVHTNRLAIEDGALLRGRVEAGKQPAMPAESKAAAAAASGKSSEVTPLSSGTAAD